MHISIPCGDCERGDKYRDEPLTDKAKLFNAKVMAWIDLQPRNSDYRFVRFKTDQAKADHSFDNPIDADKIASFKRSKPAAPVVNPDYL
jgi:hypothetical protein